LNDQAAKKKMDNFQESCKNILKMALNHYEEFAH